jgi:hypothetical protein
MSDVFVSGRSFPWEEHVTREFTLSRLAPDTISDFHAESLEKT